MLRFPPRPQTGRRLRNSRPSAIERHTPAFDPCTLKQSSPKPRPVWGTWRLRLLIGSGPRSHPRAGNGRRERDAACWTRRRELRQVGGVVAAKLASRSAAIDPIPSPPAPEHRSPSSKPRWAAEARRQPRPTSGAPTCPENGRGFGEDCLSVQGSSGWVFRSIAEGREFRRRRPFSGLEGTGTPASPRSGARTQAAGVASSLPPPPL